MEMPYRLLLLGSGILILGWVLFDLLRDWIAPKFKTSAITEPTVITEQLAEPQPLKTPKLDTPARSKTAADCIAIHLMANSDNGFSGAELMQALQADNFHFGRQEIFHRHFYDDGEGEVLYSVLKAVEPGYFYYNMLSQEQVPGITLLLLPEKVSNLEYALYKMQGSIKTLAAKLDAKILGPDFKPLSLADFTKFAETQLA